MSWNYAYTPNIWPSFLTVLLLLTLAIYSGRKRNMPGAVPFTIGSLLAGLWVAGSVFRHAAVDVETKIFWYKFESLWQLAASTAITCFVLDYAWPGRWLTRRNLILLSTVPLVDIVLILTSTFHHLEWRSFTFEGFIIPRQGFFGWFALAYAFSLGIVNLIILGWLFWRSPQHRWPVTLMLTGQIPTRIIYLLGAIGVIHSHLPLDTLGIGFLFLMYAIVLFGFRIFDPIPLARQTAVQQMHSGMVVLDSKGRITNLNPAAERMLGKPASLLRGTPIKRLLPGYPAGPLPVPDEAETELSAGTGEETRHYTLLISLLRDFRQLEIGRLLLLRDVTEQKQAQAKIVEQQQAMAILQEREHLARDLHDSIGQVLSYVALQSQAILRWMREGDTTTAETQLDRMIRVTQDAHSDLRDSIQRLRSGAPENWSFLAALQQYLDTYQRNFGINAELSLPPSIVEESFTAGVGAELIRVIQEALTNARKHAQARNVRVVMTCEDKQATITVADDGWGFYPDAAPTDGCNHFGLLFMRERVAQIGGSLSIHSSLGEGTQVIMQIPINGRVLKNDKRTIGG